MKSSIDGLLGIHCKPNFQRQQAVVRCQAAQPQRLLSRPAADSLYAQRSCETTALAVVPIQPERASSRFLLNGHLRSTLWSASRRPWSVNLARDGRMERSDPCSTTIPTANYLRFTTPDE